MSYKLEKPYTEQEKADFIVLHNHTKGLLIQETDKALFALEKNEIIVNDMPIINENYENEIMNLREEIFKQDFFETSLGWIRRKVNMKDGSKKDFLSDLLLQIKAGVEMGQMVNVLTYKTPDFSQELTTDYILSLQDKKFVTQDFIIECLNQTVRDFQG